MLLLYEESFLLLHISRMGEKIPTNVNHYLGRQALNINTEHALPGFSEKNKQDKIEAVIANSHRAMEWPGLKGTWKSPIQPGPEHLQVTSHLYDLRNLLFFPFQLTSCMFLKTHDNFIEVWCVEKVRKLGAKYRSLPVKKWSTVKITWITCFKRKQLLNFKSCRLKVTDQLPLKDDNTDESCWHEIRFRKLKFL